MEKTWVILYNRAATHETAEREEARVKKLPEASCNTEWFEKVIQIVPNTMCKCCANTQCLLI